MNPGEIIREVVSYIFGVAYGAVYYHISKALIIYALFIWILVLVFFKKWRQLSVLILLLGTVCVGAFRILYYPIRVHPDETKGGARYLEVYQEWFDTHGFSLSVDNDAPYLRCFWRKNLDHDARPRAETIIASHAFWLATRLYGHDIVAYRMSVVFTGALCVLFFFFLLRSMFGFMPALVGSFMLALSPWQLALSRIHLPYMATNTAMVICVYLLWQGLKYPVLFLPLGILIGYSVPLYSTIKAAYYFIPAYLIYAVFRSKTTQHAQVGLVLTALLVLCILSVQGPGTYNSFYGYHLGRATYLVSVKGMLSSLEVIFNFSWDAFISLKKQSYIEMGLKFSPWVQGMALAGIILCLVRIKDPRSVFLLLWFLTAIAPDAFSSMQVTVIKHISRRATQVIAPMMALAVYPLVLLPRWPRRILAVLIIGVSIYGAHAGYFNMYYLLRP